MDYLEFTAALDELGLSQAAFARLTGYDKQTVNRWATNYRQIPPAIPVIMKLLLNDPTRIAELQQLATTSD